MSDCSTHAFDVPLRECPFCGGEAEVIEADYGMYMTGYAVYCRKCCLKLGVTGRLGESYEWSPVFDTEAEAIIAWNSRADYHGYEQAAIEAWENIKAWNSRAELRSEPVSMRTFDSMETALSIAEKEVEIEELRRENYELCKENEELAHRRAELESTAHGTLTAEQVRETVDKHWHDLPAEYDMPEATALPEYSYDWQAIADELNSRAERTCNETTIDKFFNGCDSCGYMWQFFYSIGKRERPNYCPNCGARVVE